MDAELEGVDTRSVLVIGGEEKPPRVARDPSEFLRNGSSVAGGAGAKDDPGVSTQTADAIVEQNANARIAGLRSSLSVMAIIALIAVFFSFRIPTEQPASTRPT